MSEMKDRLKELRKVLDVKQREVAEKINVSVGLVGRWEAGLQPVPEHNVYRICKEFGVRREWLETGVGEMFEPGETEEDKFVAVFTTLYEALPEDWQKLFKRVARKLLGVEDDVQTPTNAPTPRPENMQEIDLDEYRRLVAAVDDCTDDGANA